ncbi:cupin domain-containing protein [Shewanella fidelis]|uniref:Cupin domain-containing protein n=1 Tax=Shewanella fidelis TaxID=173509 RepID=A0AAW8NRR1_9GAMM|nr:cupin domain-containing protein [Shewanella fidelis]MDR8524876.1 cupin domain-containing protein [Shewanella fidelis]MDW4810947.1 cupin domain-containing protein [Shewanella fidelis]MDW4815274.1 cupin domain-containing protein [Shewanella fidelis]MDW4819364.1 cupin domain-containing protein [Shewanella fidelis]MDW4822958.1 cupin domain-containing protein [Shewanella fidelis]
MVKNIDSILNFAKLNSAIERYKLDAEKIIKGDPNQQLQNHYSSDCEQFHVGVWRSEIGTWKVAYSEHEYCEILSGSSKVTDINGHSITVKTGDRFVIPAGFEGTWEVLDNCQKVYVIFEANTQLNN